ncbi:Altered inheritance of mitochondria protein 32 [Hypsizygus marmoreus]|uniref:Altered inheritance of mitochondria protein 32 n=1 Tax=Hypsizygus marmoreus TaxID=39966 RepID=A0A369K086_HYPMA|nr:Altered inheritance of mitochondria protein 32 [Hypsizygus marmoreus]
MPLGLRPLSHIRCVGSRPFTTSRRRLVVGTDVDSKTQQDEPPRLFGTVPSHRSYIFLHSSDPPASFPSRVSTPIQRALQLRVLKWGGIVNFSWFEHSASVAIEGRNSATAFSTLGGRLEIPEISLENVDDIDKTLRAHAEGSLVEEGTSDDIHLYVCTHGARDCRCGTTGGEVASALREEVARRLRTDPSGPISRVKVGEVGHVGGHQYAANLLVYPHGEWLGRLKPHDVLSVLSSILEHAPRPFSGQMPPLVPQHWRGRMGLSKDEQIQLLDAHSHSSKSL